MKKIGNVLESILGRINIHKKEKDIYSSWPNLIEVVFCSSGQTISKDIVQSIAEQTRIIKIEDGKMTVETQHGGWSQILLTKQQEILDMIHKKHPNVDIHKIDCVLKK